MGQFGQPRVFGRGCTRLHYHCPQRGVTRLPHVPAPQSPPAHADRATPSPWGAGGAGKGLVVAGMGYAGNPTVRGISAFPCPWSLSVRGLGTGNSGLGATVPQGSHPWTCCLCLCVCCLSLGKEIWKLARGMAAGGSPSGSWHYKGLWGPCPNLLVRGSGFHVLAWGL